MSLVPLFEQISPTDYRYSVDTLKPYLTEEAFVKYKSKVEAALVQVLARRGLVPQRIADEITRAAEEVTAIEVYDEESRTRHDIIAQVNMIRKRVSDEAKSVVHRAATSYDIVDTANALRYKDAFKQAIIPDIVGLEKVWIDTTRKEKDTLQIGRTHLQHAEPITFGFAIAWYVDRFGGRILEVKRSVDNLRGKFSGAVGAYNASSLFVQDSLGFEEEVLEKLGLTPAGISTQIVQPEFVTDLVHYTISAFGVLANWADDMRNLMRPEIGEVGLPRGPDVSRSSTMPHKANPIGPENIKSLWKEAMPRIITIYLDQLSDHQRDLTNSASQRYTPEIFDLFDYAVTRATRVSKNIRVHPHNMRKNLEISKNTITAEPLQLLLSSLGYYPAHEVVGELADRSVETGKSVVKLALEDSRLHSYMEKLTQEQMRILTQSEQYTGLASYKAEEISSVWEEILKEEKLW